MNRKVLVFALGIFFTMQMNLTLAQNETKREAVFLEVFGSGIFYSFNYDRRIMDRPNGLGIKAGLGYTAIDGVRITTLPIAGNLLIGKKRSFFELGAGATFLLVSQTSNVNVPQGSSIRPPDAVLFNLILGYRRVAESGFLLRAGITPYLNSDPVAVFVPQISIGYAF